MSQNKGNDNFFHPISDLNSIIGKSRQALYLYQYLTSTDINAKGFVIEFKYVDKDFLIDFANFYARAFKNFERFTTRLHFFGDVFTNTEIKEAIGNNDKKIRDRIDKSYLGFIVKKPIQNFENQPLVGKTILKTYKKDVEGEIREFLRHNYNVSFFGIPLKINSLPFQVQDPAVGACATTACWVALHPLSELFGTEKQSPFEVTELSVAFPSPERNFPSEGLSTFQMKYYFNSIGLESEFISPSSIPDENEFFKRDIDDTVADIVKSYINLGLPVIALLDLWKTRSGKMPPIPDDYHAAVISGYRHKNGKITELYIHDDRIGPYHHVKPNNNFLEWKNGLNDQGYSIIKVKKLLIPIYPKIRLKFGFIYQAYLELKRAWEKRGDVEHVFNMELLLFESKKYKEFLADKKFNHVITSESKEIVEDKFTFLTSSQPRYLWVARRKINDKLDHDGIFDATIVYPEATLIQYE